MLRPDKYNSFATMSARALTVCTLLVLVKSIAHEATPTRGQKRGLTQLIQDFRDTTARYGYQSEAHTAVTEDGYLLTMFRLGRQGLEPRGIPVLLMHGLLQSSDSWVDAGPNAGLAYLLAEAGYDLWIGNVRGNYYSRRHIHLKTKDPAFWEFTTDEIGRYDIPAMVDYILRATGSAQLNYIGFSQGGGAYFIMCSEFPQYCNKARVIIAISPSTRHLLTRSALFRVVTQGSQQFEDLLHANGFYEIFTRGALTQELLSFFCRRPELATFCGKLKEFLDSVNQINKRVVTQETVRNLVEHFPAGTSVRNMARFGQAMNNEKFLKFDFGKKKNLKIYGTARPPEYNLSAVTVPVVAIYGVNDGVVDKGDVEWTLERLPIVLESYIVEDPLWSHLDAMYSRYTRQLLFPKIHEYLLKYS